ncbi:MAG: ribonuclease D [Hyphomicrobiaceae bacterium]|nr:MAG: ribonuclease D [Hyphomicrobiaceae bacterium]
MSIKLHQDDLPASVSFKGSVAIDTETMGLKLHRDRLCLVQLSAGDGKAHLVQLKPGAKAPRLKGLLADTSVLKIFHFARFDMGVLKKSLGEMPAPVYCTKIASKLARTYTDRHGLKDLVKDLLGVEVSKEQQSSDWGGEKLTDQQRAYAAQDVLHLHELKARLDAMIAREGRVGLAEACFKFLPTRVALDLLDWEEVDIFAH